ncbi:MAG: hypothetical protein IJI68_00980 [Eggerthellaceae bacterium]|nr:hypothetical protein [Eggerthellaceae bacterium]
MPVEVIVAIIGAIEAIGVAIIGGIITAYRRKDEADRKAQAERDLAREKRDSANYDLLFSVADGVEVLLEQAHGDKMNGNIEAALNSVRKAKSNCNHIYNAQVAKL